MPAPIVVATTQATCLSAISNILAQLILGYRKGDPWYIDNGQFFRFVFITVMTAPPNYYWQALLERTFPGRRQGARPHRDEETAYELEEQRKADADNLLAGDPMTAPNTTSATTGSTFARLTSSTSDLNKRNTATKWFIDCITLGAIFNTTAFLTLLGLLKHKTVAEIGLDLRHEMWPIIFAGYKIWPLASIISFTFVPVEKRIVWLSFVGLWWGVYMSMVAAAV